MLRNRFQRPAASLATIGDGAPPPVYSRNEPPPSYSGSTGPDSHQSSSLINETDKKYNGNGPFDSKNQRVAFDAQRSNAESTSQSHTKEDLPDKLEILRAYDTVIIVDDSGSMRNAVSNKLCRTSRWQAVCTWV